MKIIVLFYFRGFLGFINFVCVYGNVSILVVVVVVFKFNNGWCIIFRIGYYW